MVRKVGVTVFCLDSNGAPDVQQFTVETSDPSFKDGDHLQTAKLLAKEQGFDPKYACDEDDMLKRTLPKLEALYPEYFTKARGRTK